MAWPKGQGKGPSTRFQIRLDEDSAAFYRRKAKEAGLSVSDLLRRLLHEGIVAENVQDVEERLRALIATTLASSARAEGGIADDIALSVITAEALLTAIVGDQDPQALYKAQEAARAKFQRLKGARDV